MATPANIWMGSLLASCLIALNACSDKNPKTQPQQPQVPQAAPVAQAGKDQTAGAFNLVRLDGSASKANDGSQLTYQWKQLNSNWVVVDGGLNNPRVSFYIPATGIPTEGAEFELTVTDSAGKTHRDSVKVLPELCSPAPGDLLSNCFSLAKQPVQINNNASPIKEGYGTSGAQMQWALIDSEDVKIGKVLDVKTVIQSTQNNLASQTSTKSQNTLAIQAAQGHPQDLSSVGNGIIEFDMRLLTAAADAEFFTSIGCFNNCAPQILPLSLAQGSQWQHIKLPLRDYFAQGIDLSQITQMLAISVRSANSSVTHFQLDNIKWQPEEGGSIPADLDLTPSQPFQIGFPAPSGATANISAVIPGIGTTNLANGPISPLSWELQDGSLIIKRRNNQASELILDLSNSWGQNIASYVNEYSLRLTISNTSNFGNLNVSFGFKKGDLIEYSNEQQMIVMHQGRAYQFDIPLSSFTSLSDFSLQSLRLRMTGEPGAAPINLSKIELVKPNIAISAAVNSPMKIGAVAQEGETYNWQQWAGTESELINNTRADSAQIEFDVPGQKTSVPLILTRETTTPDSVKQDMFVIYRLGDCKLPQGVVFQDCLANQFGPLKVFGSMTFGTTYLIFPDAFTSLFGSFLGKTYPISWREVLSTDPQHAQVIDVSHRFYTGSTTYNGQFFIPFAEQQLIDWQAFARGSLEFDLNIIDYGDSGEALTLGTGIMRHSLPPQSIGQWQHISVPLPSADVWLGTLGDQPPFSIQAPNQSRGGLHYQIDNIQFKKAAN